MDELPSPFRLDIKAALTEIAASIVVFSIVYRLGFGGEHALMIGVAAQYGVRLWRKGVFGPPEKRVDDRHIPILTGAHALTWLNIFCLAGTGAVLEGANPQPILRHIVSVAFLLSLAVASRYAWGLIWSKVDRPRKD